MIPPIRKMEKGKQERNGRIYQSNGYGAIIAQDGFVDFSDKLVEVGRTLSHSLTAHCRLMAG